MKTIDKQNLFNFLNKKSKLKTISTNDIYFIDTLTKYLSEYLDQYHTNTPFDFEIGERVFVVRKNHNGKYGVLEGSVIKRTDHGKGKTSYEVLGMNLSNKDIFKIRDDAEKRSDELNGFQIH